MLKDKYNKISLKAFTHLFNESEKCNRRFCFILGSGTSREAGILTGVEMAELWSKELDNKYEQNELNELMKKLDVRNIEPSSKNYFGIYDLLFYPDYQEGHAYFERELEKGVPSLGHHTLAKILSGKTHNLAITTNFDSLIEDALFIYTNKRPLVVGHESLTQFINLNISRPIVAKIHRSLYFQPFNRKEETDGLALGWQDTLRNAFMVYTPIVIGYAGGDQSLMKFLSDDSIKMNGLYWCYWNKEEPSDDIINLVNSKNGCFVPIEGFDQMMFMLSRKLGFENPEDEMKCVTQARIERYNSQYSKFDDEIRNKAKDAGSTNESIRETVKALDVYLYAQLNEAIDRLEEEKTYDNYLKLANANFQLKMYKECIDNYTEAIKLNPTSGEAYYKRGDCYVRTKQYQNAIEDYVKAIERRYNSAVLLNNLGYAYLYSKEYDKALDSFQKSKECNPKMSQPYKNIGELYFQIKQYNKALIYLDEATSLDPNNVEIIDLKKKVIKAIQEFKDNDET